MPAHLRWATAKQRLILIFSIRQKPIIFMNFKPFLENFLNNSSFFLLLCSMLFYWIHAFFNISFFSYSGKLAIRGANLTMLFLLIYRGLCENHFPLSNHAIKKKYHSFLRNADIFLKKYKQYIARESSCKGLVHDQDQPLSANILSLYHRRLVS